MTAIVFGALNGMIVLMAVVLISASGKPWLGVAFVAIFSYTLGIQAARWLP